MQEQVTACHCLGKPAEGLPPDKGLSYRVYILSFDRWSSDKGLSYTVYILSFDPWSYMSPCGWILAHLWPRSCCISLLQVSLVCIRWAGHSQAAPLCKSWESVVMTAGVELLEGRLVYYWQRLWHLQQDPPWHRHPCASSPLPSGVYFSFRFLSLYSFVQTPSWYPLVGLLNFPQSPLDDQPSWTGLHVHQSHEKSSDI